MAAANVSASGLSSKLAVKTHGRTITYLSAASICDEYGRSQAYSQFMRFGLVSGAFCSYLASVA